MTALKNAALNNNIKLPNKIKIAVWLLSWSSSDFFCNSWERQRRYFHFTNQLLPDLIIMCTEGEVFQLIDRNEYQPQKFMILWWLVAVAKSKKGRYAKEPQSGVCNEFSAQLRIVCLQNSALFSSSTVFENHRKSHIQHCERSELRLHFEWTKVN